MSAHSVISAMVAGATAMLVLSCGDGAVEPTPSPTPVVTTVTVSPDSVALTALAQTARLTAEVRDQNGQAVTDVAVAWASSDVSVAAVDASGLVTAAANGSATITATAGAVSGAAGVTVMQSAASVQVSPPSIELTALGETVQLTAAAYDQNGHAVAEAAFSWESNDSSVATVDAVGLVMAVGNSRYTRTSAGRVPTEVTAMIDSVTGRSHITVRQAVAEVVVSPATDTIWGSGIVVLTAESFDANGHPVYYEGRADGEPIRSPVFFDWSSDNPDVVQVDGDGQGNPLKVTGLAEGTATITASTHQGSVGWLGSGSGGAEITVATPLPGSRYPIHIIYLGDVPEDLRWGMESAAATWGRILVPTEAAPFVFDQPWEGYGGIWSEMGSFEAGDILAPGLHLYVVENSSRKGVWGWAGPVGARRRGTSDVPMEPMGVVALNGERFENWKNLIRESQPHMADYFQQVHQIAMHEIAHVLGIGTSERWSEWLKVPDPEEPWNAYFTDPDAIAVFDRMGGTDFPEATPKIPLTADHAHWDGCAGHFDILGNSLNTTSTATELTMASLSEGYVYDPAMAPDRKLDPERWTREFTRCLDGQWDPEFGRSAAEVLNPWAFGSFEGDVIRPRKR